MGDHFLYDRTFTGTSDELNTVVRQAAFGRDIGQFSWTTYDEYEGFARALRVDARTKVLDVACGSGGPSLFLAESIGCEVVGVDIHTEGIATANDAAATRGLAGRARYLCVDASARLPFDQGTFDAIISIDSMNHLGDRDRVFREWRRVLRPGGRFVFTDAVIMRGALTRAEMLARSPAMGEFWFTPEGMHERSLHAAGFVDIATEDVTANIVGVAERWRAARERYSVALIDLESATRFDEFQRFLLTVSTVAAENRLVRLAYHGQAPN